MKIVSPQVRVIIQQRKNPKAMSITTTSQLTRQPLALLLSFPGGTEGLAARGSHSSQLTFIIQSILCRDNIVQYSNNNREYGSISGLLGPALRDHFGLDAVGVLEIGLVGVGVLRVDHPLPALLLVLLLRALLADHLQVLHQRVHLLLPSLLVALDVVDHHVDALLRLLEVVRLSLLHVLLDCLSGLHPQVVFDHVHILVDLCDLLVGVDEGEGETTRAGHLLALHALSAEDSLADHMLAADVSDLPLDLGDSELKDEVLGDLRHQLRDLDAVLALLELLPLVSVNLADLHSSHHARCDAAHMHGHLVGHQRNYTAEGVAEGLIKGAQLLDEVESAVLESADLVHEVLIMICSETEAVDAKNSQLGVLLPSQRILEGFLSSFVLAVRKQEDRGHLVGDLAIPDGLEGQIHAAHDTGSSRGEQVVDVVGEHNHIFLSDSLEAADAVSAAVEGNDGEAVGGSEGLNKEAHGLLDQLNLIAIHRAADIDHADQIHAGPGAATGHDGAHRGQDGHLSELHLRALGFQLELHLALLPHLLHALHELLVIVEDARHFPLGLLLPLDHHVRPIAVVPHPVDLRGDSDSRLRHGHLNWVLHLLLLNGHLLDWHLLRNLSGNLLNAVGKLLLLGIGHRCLLGGHLFALHSPEICYLFITDIALANSISRFKDIIITDNQNNSRLQSLENRLNLLQMRSSDQIYLILFVTLGHLVNKYIT